MLRQSAFKAVARSVASSAPAAAQRRAMTSARAPSASASSSSSSRATRATVLFGAGVGSVALALAGTKQTPIHNETSAQGSTAVPPKRLTWIERAKANKGGVIVIPRAAIEEEEAEEEEEDDGEVAIEAEEVETLSPSGTLESDSVETIAAVVSEDTGASAGSEGEEEEDQGAYDPKTGTINWDCPCLGGMAHGPCGEHFKAAFSCFIYSEGEPKGIECVDKFKAMQDCFRAHPEVYSEELEMDEQDELESLIEETETALGIERLIKEEQALGAQQTVVS